jgi:subtilisin family serine protease
MSILRRIFHFSVSAAALFAQDVARQGRENQPAQPSAAPNAFIVAFRPGAGPAVRAAAAAQAGAQVRFNFTHVDAIAIRAAGPAAVDALRRNPLVASVTPDYVVTTAQKGGKPGGGGGGGGGGGTATPFVFDTRQVLSYPVQRVGAPGPQNDGTGIGVAIGDTGIDFNHTDLAPSPTAFSAFGASCQDDHAHGTHVTGLLAALSNDRAIVGVAPGAKPYCVKMLDATGSGSDATIMAGLDWILTNRNAVSPPIRVVNLSLGRPLATGETIASSPTRALVQALYNAGVIVVAAAGNNPNVDASQMVPAGFPEVISVASTTTPTGVRTCLLFNDPTLEYVPADTASGFTTDGASVTISAPGEEQSDIVTLGYDCVGLQYGSLSTTRGTGSGATRKVAGAEARGTSFAAPLVAGIVARILQKALVSPTFNAAEVEAVRAWITNNASRKGEAPLTHPWEAIYGQTFDGVREGIAQAPR